MKKYQIAILVVAIVAIVGVAFIVPVKHEVTYQFDHAGSGQYVGLYAYQEYENGVFQKLVYYDITFPPQDYTYYAKTINWNYPDSPTFDFSWLH